MRKNLLKETIEDLAQYNKTLTDIEFCSIIPSEYSWRDQQSGYFDVSVFTSLADKDYDAGFGGAEVNQSLKLVGKDFWLERHEYDGSEWWEYKTLPLKPESILETPNIWEY